MATEKRVTVPVEAASFVFECRECGSRLSVPLAIEKTSSARLLTGCSVCNAEWLGTSGEEYQQLRDRLRDLALVLQRYISGDWPFRILVECGPR